MASPLLQERGGPLETASAQTQPRPLHQEPGAGARRDPGLPSPWPHGQGHPSQRSARIPSFGGRARAFVAVTESLHFPLQPQGGDLQHRGRA